MVSYESIVPKTGWHVNELKGWYFAIQTKREGVNFIDKAKGNIEILLY